MLQGIVTPQSPQNQPSSIAQRNAPQRSHFRGSSLSNRHVIEARTLEGVRGARTLRSHRVLEYRERGTRLAFPPMDVVARAQTIATNTRRA